MLNSHHTLGKKSIGDFLPQHEALRRTVDGDIDALIEKERHPDIRRQLRAALYPGRRLRPVLFLHLCASLGLSGTSRPVRTVALALELAHRASILVDDLVDRDELRRQSPTYHAAEGEQLAILVSHLLVSKAFQEMARVKGPSAAGLQEAFAKAYRSMAVAEIADLGLLEAEEGRQLELYEEVILPKTAALFEFLFIAAGELDPSRSSLKRSASSLGRKLGSLYQVYNDIYDEFFADLNERGSGGKKMLSLSLPVCQKLDLGDARTRKTLMKLVGRQLSPKEVQTVRDVLVSANGDNAAFHYADRLWSSTVDDLESVRSEKAKDLMTRFGLWLQQKKCWDHRETQLAGY